MKPQQDMEKPVDDAAPSSLTMQAQAILLDCPDFDQGVDAIRNQLLSASVREYFSRIAKSSATSRTVERIVCCFDYIL